MKESSLGTVKYTKDAESEHAKFNKLRRNNRTLDILVQVTSVTVAILLVIFFIFISQSLPNMQSKMLSVKESAQPVSVAAGHIETNLVRMRTALEFFIETDLTQSDLAKLKRWYESDSVQTVKFMDLLQPSSLNDSRDVDMLRADYEKLNERMQKFFELGEAGDGSEKSKNDIIGYATRNLIPLLSEMITLDNAILDDTTFAVSSAYSSITNSVRDLFVLSGVLISLTIALIVIYLLLLNARTTRENELRESLQDALVAAQNVNEAKSAFLSNMSHDIRTPMNAIVGLTTIANENIDDKLRVKQCLTRIATSSQHLLSLINDVLDMNKIESGKVTLAEEQFSLSDLLSEIVTILQGQPKLKQLKSEIIVSEIRHERLIGDTMRLRQIILNLTSNSIKYTNEGDSFVLSVRENEQTEPGKANFSFIVSDTGIGMTPEFLRNIFEPFEREKNDFTVFTEGTGLGMAITKNLVDLIGGEITIDSALGVGTTVQIDASFKIADDPESADGLKGSVGEEDLVASSLPDASRLEGMRALVVDSNDLVMSNTVNILKGFGMDAVGATSGEEAVELTKEARRKSGTLSLSEERSGNGDKPQPEAGAKPFEIIIMDEKLPDASALEVVEMLRKEFPLDRVGSHAQVIISSYDVDSLAQVADDADISLLVAKPLFRSRLYKVLQAMLDGSSTEKVVSLEKKVLNLGGRVLVVEDNPINMEIATTLIGERGPVVEEAMNGLEALAKVSEAEEGHYDLIFMDWRMPHMDGIEATKSINKHLRQHNRKHIPIIAMTANAFDSDRQVAMEAGMDGFMAKPINLTELEAVLQKYLPKGG